MTENLWLAIAGTVVLWAVSGSMAVALGPSMAAGSLSINRLLRHAARAGVNVTRGVPTSLFVIAAGIGMMRLSSAPELPVIYPGTSTAFQHVAWGVVFALGCG